MFENLGIFDIEHYVLAALAIILVPGPNSIFVLTTAIKKGVKKGYQAALGVFFGDSLIMLAVYIGIAAFINEHPELMLTPMRYFSAGFLFFLAAQILYGTYGKPFLERRKNAKTPSTEITADNSSNPSNPANRPELQFKILKKERNPFLKAVLLSLTNPKALLFFFVFFHKFIDPTFTPTYLPFLILASILMLISVSYLSALIFGGSALMQFVKGHAWLGTVGNTLVALIFLLFSYQILTTHLVV